MNYMQFFLVIFPGFVMLPHPQTMSTDHDGPRTYNHSNESRRNVSTSPPLPFLTVVVTVVIQVRVDVHCQWYHNNTL